MKKKETKVIKILDEFTVVINAGATDVQLNDKIIIFEPGPTINDLDGTELGRYDFKKAELIVTEVYPNFTIAKHLKEGNAFSLAKNLTGTTFMSNGPLVVNKNEITKISPKNPSIVVGDLVKLI